VAWQERGFDFNTSVKRPVSLSPVTLRDIEIKKEVESAKAVFSLKPYYCTF
jgi:hypothetical protein